MGFLRCFCLGILLFSVAGCGIAPPAVSQPSLNPALTTCPANVHQIAVQDTSLTSLCGCGLPSGLAIASGASLNCTVQAPAQVRFVFIGGFGPHQILPSGLPAFSPPSGVIDLRGRDGAETHVVLFDASTPGQTYRFVDAFNPGSLGAIVVP